MQRYLRFDDIAKEILENKKFQLIEYERHHGINRMEHTLRVAKYVYKISKFLGLDYVSATRGALLHDFFLKRDFGYHKGLITGVVHPDIALANAKGEFEVNEIEANAIEAHMFPLSKVLPRYKESWVLTAVDKGVAIYEDLAFKFHYSKLTAKVNYAFSLTSIFLFNILTMGDK